MCGRKNNARLFREISKLEGERREQILLNFSLNPQKISKLFEQKNLEFARDPIYTTHT